MPKGVYDRKKRKSATKRAVATGYKTKTRSRKATTRKAAPRKTDRRKLSRVGRPAGSKNLNTEIVAHLKEAKAMLQQVLVTQRSGFLDMWRTYCLSFVDADTAWFLHQFHYSALCLGILPEQLEGARPKNPIEPGTESVSPIMKSESHPEANGLNVL